MKAFGDRFAYNWPTESLLLAFLNAEIVEQMLPVLVRDEEQWSSIEVAARKPEESGWKLLTNEQKTVAYYLDEVQKERLFAEDFGAHQITLAEVLDRRIELWDMASIFFGPRKCETDRLPRVRWSQFSNGPDYEFLWDDPTSEDRRLRPQRVERTIDAQELLEIRLDELSLGLRQMVPRKGPGRPRKDGGNRERLCLRIVDRTIALPFLALANLLYGEPHGHLRMCALDSVSAEDLTTVFAKRRRVREFSAGCYRWFLATRKNEIYCCSDHQEEARRRKENRGPGGLNAHYSRKYRTKSSGKKKTKGKK